MMTSQKMEDNLKKKLEDDPHQKKMEDDLKIKIEDDLNKNRRRPKKKWITT